MNRDTSYELLKEVLKERGEYLHNQYLSAILTAVQYHKEFGYKIVEASEIASEKYHLPRCEKPIRDYMKFIYAKQKERSDKNIV